MNPPIAEITFPIPEAEYTLEYTLKVWHSEREPGKFSFSITDHNNQPVESTHSSPDGHHKYGQFDNIALALAAAINELLAPLAD